MCGDIFVCQVFLFLYQSDRKVLIILNVFLSQLTDMPMHTHAYVCAHAKLLHLSPTLCNPTDCSPPGSSVHGIPQARKLEWVAMPSSKGSSQPRDQTHISYVSYVGSRILYHYCHWGSLYIKHTHTHTHGWLLFGIRSKWLLLGCFCLVIFCCIYLLNLSPFRDFIGS